MSLAFRLSPLLAALLLSACIAPSVVPPRRLLLAYEGAVPVESTAARPRLVVRAVTVPDYLDRRNLIHRVGSAELRQYDEAEWAERPAKSITRWMTQALAVQRPDYAVQSYSTPDGRAPDATFSLTLDSFEVGADGLLRLRGSWAFALRSEVASLTGRFDADVKPGAETPDAIVAAMQQALKQATLKLVERLPPASSL